MYGDEVAEVYDLVYGTGVGKDYPAEAAAIVELVRARHPEANSLLDVACGTGEHLRHLREAFDQVAGVELAEPMRRIASRKLPEIPIHDGDLRSFALDATFDAVTCLFSSIGYVQGEAELRQAVARMAAHLNPGGVLVVDGWLTPDQWHDGWVGSDVAQDGERTVQRMSYSTRTGRSSQMRMHHLVGVRGVGVRYFYEDHTLTLFTTEEYLAALTAAGLVDVDRVAGGHAGRDRLVGTRPRACP